jgi:hypothetical protein
MRKKGGNVISMVTAWLIDSTFLAKIKKIV